MAKNQLNRLKSYCVLCGVDLNDKNGLDKCSESELALSHLWATIGVVLPWFKVKRYV